MPDEENVPILNKPNITGNKLNLNCKKEEFDPISLGFGKSQIVFDQQKYICRKLNLNNKKFQTRQKQKYLTKIKTLEKLTWQQSKDADKQGNGYRWIQRSGIKATIPDELKNVPAFICWKYDKDNALVFGGFYLAGIHYVVWIGQASDDIYAR